MVAWRQACVKARVYVRAWTWARLKGSASDHSLRHQSVVQSSSRAGSCTEFNDFRVNGSRVNHGLSPHLTAFVAKAKEHRRLPTV